MAGQYLHCRWGRTKGEGSSWFVSATRYRNCLLPRINRGVLLSFSQKMWARYRNWRLTKILGFLFRILLPVIYLRISSTITKFNNLEYNTLLRRSRNTYRTKKTKNKESCSYESHEFSHLPKIRHCDLLARRDIRIVLRINRLSSSARYRSLASGQPFISEPQFYHILLERVRSWFFA